MDIDKGVELNNLGLSEFAAGNIERAISLQKIVTDAGAKIREYWSTLD